MITLSLLKYLEDHNLGTIDQDMFWQKLSLGKTGIYITSIGQGITRGSRTVQRYEIYSRGANDVEGLKRLEDIIEFLNDSYGECNLPSVPGLTDGFVNVTIKPLGTPTNVGEDATGHIMWSVSGDLIY